MSKDAARAINFRTPGVAPIEVEPDIEALVSDTSDVDMPPAVVSSAAPDLKAYIDEQIAKGISAGMKTIKKAQSNPAAPLVELPDQDAVDPHKIKDMVLTKQGYVVPAGYGAAPAHIALQVMPVR